MTDDVFVADRVLPDVSFRAARARLGILAGGGVLLRAFEGACGEAITGMDPETAARCRGTGSTWQFRSPRRRRADLCVSP